MSGAAIPLDPRNPGQVLACVGLWELVCRRWGPQRGWFELEAPAQCCLEASLEQVQGTIGQLQQAPLTEQEERLCLGPPFDLTLDWWLDRGDEVVPKTWAGRQTPKAFFASYCSALEPELPLQEWFDLACTDLQAASFCFDCREFSHRLDTGFSIDNLQLEPSSFVFVELLAFIGLQRFRPAPRGRGEFSYRLWTSPLLFPLGAFVFSGAWALPGCQHYTFRLRPRDRENRYKGFSPSYLQGGQE